MTIDELKACNGFIVQVSLDGESALSTIDTLLSPDGQPKLSCPPPNNGDWTDVTLLPISVEVHHALMDGLHVGRYVMRLEELLAEAEKYLTQGDGSCQNHLR